MRPIVDYAHSKGLTFGLYTCAGNATCAGARPGSNRHWTDDAKVMAEWTVDYVKVRPMHCPFQTSLSHQSSMGCLSRDTLVVHPATWLDGLVLRRRP